MELYLSPILKYRPASPPAKDTIQPLLSLTDPYLWLSSFNIDCIHIALVCECSLNAYGTANRPDSFYFTQWSSQILLLTALVRIPT
jgi:hypothetical protein